MSATNEQLLTSTAEAKKGRAEADWKKIESEKRVSYSTSSNSLYTGICVSQVHAAIIHVHMQYNFAHKYFIAVTATE